MKNQENIPIILASTSPRRIFLLSQMGLSVEVERPSVEETQRYREKPQRLVVRLAYEKAESVREIAVQKYERSIVIAADTIVLAPNSSKVLGKPKGAEEACKMLKMLSGKTHTVLSGYCILLASRRKEKKKVVRFVKSTVKMRILSKLQIERYVRSGEPLDKAGSYGAQGLGAALIERIDGSYTNVVGLPVSQVLMDVESKFGVPLFGWLK